MKYYERGNVPHYFLAGLVSYGPKNCGTKDIPGVYTRISKYIEWIQNNLKDWSWSNVSVDVKQNLIKRA
jgi:secreted trypsin-like serine protease